MDNNKKFWKGALCGALATLLVVGIVGGTILIFGLMNRQEAIVDKKTEQKLEMLFYLKMVL